MITNTILGRFMPERIADLIEQDVKAPAAIVENILYEDGVLIIAGPPKGGKSYLSVALALSLATGKDFLGRFKVPEPRRVLIIAEEDSRGRFAERFRRVAAGMGIAEIPPDILLISRKAFKLDDPDMRTELIAVIKDFRPEVLFLDPLSRIHRQNENSASEFQTVIDALDELMKEFECSVVLIHHVNKMKGRDLMDTIRGSTAIAARADSVLGFYRKLTGRGERPAKTQILTEGKDGDSAMDFTLVYDRDGSRDFLTCEDSPEHREEKIAATLEVVTELAKDNPKGVSADQVKAKLGVSLNTAKARLIDLAKDGLLIPVPGPRRNQTRYLPKRQTSEGV